MQMFFSLCLSILPSFHESSLLPSFFIHLFIQWMMVVKLTRLQDRGAGWATRPQGRKESDTTEATELADMLVWGMSLGTRLLGF